MLTWEVYPTGGAHGESVRPQVVFNCLSNRMLRPRYVLMKGDEADAERRIALAPVGKELGHAARVHDGTRERVLADLGTLLEHQDRLVGDPLLLQEPREVDRARQVRRSRADQQHVRRQLLALDPGEVQGVLYGLRHARAEDTRTAPARKDACVYGAWIDY